MFLVTEAQKSNQAVAHIISAAERANVVNRAFIKRDLDEVNAYVKESFRMDLTNKEKYQFDSPFFSIKAFRETAYKLAREGKFREAEPVSAFSALFRALVNNVAANWYQLQPTVFEQIVAVTPSTHYVEPYAPMHRGGMPKRVGGSDNPIKEVKTGTVFDIQIQNAKFAGITAVPEELIKFDMTGQVMQRIQDIGPNMAVYEDAYAAAKFIGDATTFMGDAIPASATKPSNETSSTWPWSTAFLGGGANRQASYAAFSSGKVQELWNLLAQQKDANGNKLVVNPDTIFHGSSLKFAVSTLLNSTYYPATSAMSQAISGGTTTGIGTTFAENVLKGLFNPVMSVHLPQTAWGIGQAHKGLIQQVASGLTVVQETPNSGKSFDSGETRLKAQKYFETDWIDPRFWALGSDGTV